MANTTASSQVPGLSADAAVLSGALHIHVAFDWGEEVDLAQAQQLAPSRLRALTRRPRTPSSIAYRPPPLEFDLPPAGLELPELGPQQAAAKATVFDFAAVSVALELPFRLPAAGLRRLAGALAQSEPFVEAARAAAEPLYQQLLPAIQRPRFSDLSEEYFVFQLAPGDPLPPPDVLLDRWGAWLAALVRLEPEPLDPSEIAESLRLRLSYSPADLVVVEWSAAVVVDRDCEETLQTIELANLQLCEFRHIDGRLDDELAAAYGLIHPLARAWLPFWRTQTRPLRALGDLKIEANAVFERTSNVLKLMGDQYLARLYRLMSSRFHLDEWAESIQRTLDVVQGVYQILSDQAATYRIELLEIVIIVLIAFEILMTLAGR